MQANNPLCTSQLSSLWTASYPANGTVALTPRCVALRAHTVNCFSPCPNAELRAVSALRAPRINPLWAILEAEEPAHLSCSGLFAAAPHRTNKPCSASAAGARVPMRCSHTGEPCGQRGFYYKTRYTKQEKTSTTLHPEINTLI